MWMMGGKGVKGVAPLSYMCIVHILHNIRVFLNLVRSSLLFCAADDPVTYMNVCEKRDNLFIWQKARESGALMRMREKNCAEESRRLALGEGLCIQDDSKIKSAKRCALISYY